jgi:hypothetical protein
LGATIDVRHDFGFVQERDDIKEPVLELVEGAITDGTIERAQSFQAPQELSVNHQGANKNTRAARGAELSGSA